MVKPFWLKIIKFPRSERYMSDFSRSSNPRTVWSHRGAMEEKHNVRTIQSPDRQDNAMTQQRPAYIRRMTGDSSSSSATRTDISSTTTQPTNPLARLTLADGARDDVSPLAATSFCYFCLCHCMKHKRSLKIRWKERLHHA